MFFLFELKNKAKYISILRLVSFLILSLSTNTSNLNQKDDDWFFTALMCKDGNLGKVFDDKSITRFLSNKKDATSCYSSVCAEMNVHLAIIHEEFGINYVDPSLEYLTALTGQLNNIDKAILNSLNMVCMTDESKNKRKTDDSLCYFFYTYGRSDEETSMICNFFQQWIEENCAGKFDSDLDIRLFKNKMSIYISLLFFNEKWKEEFEKRNEDEVFTLSGGVEKMRRYMYKKEWLNYKEVNEEGFNFKIVVIPYSEQKTNSQSRVMIYLIPNKHNVAKYVLWNNFCEYKNKCKGIKNAINECTTTFISLYVPKIINLTTTLNTTDILQDIFKQSSGKNFFSEMKINLNVDEKGTSFLSKSTTYSYDSISSKNEPIEVKVNVPYIAFIYDYNIDRILLVLNDNGPVKAESKFKTSC